MISRSRVNVSIPKHQQLVPRAFEEFGYWAREPDDHTVSVGYKDKELAVFAVSENTFDAALDVIVTHFIKTVTEAAAVMAEATS